MLGRDHPDTLSTLSFVGVWAIRCGALEEGCRWLREGLTRAEARFGPDHPLTQTFQDLIRDFGCGGWTGDARGVLSLFAALSPDRERVLEGDYLDTLMTRGNVVYWTGSMGDARGALQLSIDLVPDRERVLGRDHPDTLMTRGNVVYWTGSMGDAPGRCNSPSTWCRTGSGS